MRSSVIPSAPSVPQSLSPSVPNCLYSPRSAFSFTEILFAVIILGIGFIMVAAIFPVAIEQGKLTNEQTVAASIGRGALSITGGALSNTDAGVVSSCGSLTYTNSATFTASYSNTASTSYSSSIYPSTIGGGPLLPATGTFNTTTNVLQTTGNVWSFYDPHIATFPQADTSVNPATITRTSATNELWNKISQSLILPTDPRYAFVGLFRRDGDPRNRNTWAPFAQVWIIPVTARTRTVYTPSVDANTPNVATPSTPVNLAARLIQVRIDIPTGTTTYTSQPNQGYILYLYNTGTGGYTPSALVTGCYVIIGRDNIVSTTANTATADSGRMNGRIYHVGVRRPDLDTASGNDPDNLAAQAYELSADGDFVPDAGADTIFTSTAYSSPDDIYRIGSMSTSQVTLSGVANPLTLNTTSSAPADAYVIGTDNTGADPGPAQDISAYTTFVKVN